MSPTGARITRAGQIAYHPVFTLQGGHRVAGAALIAATLFLSQTAGAWVTLFDDTNFNRWTMTGNANWRIAGGIAEADVPRGFLVWRESYGDFELRADVWTRPESNGGILFRMGVTRVDAMSAQIHPRIIRMWCVVLTP
jgi:hypothetical protein